MGPFKPEYKHVTHYLLDGHLVQTYIRNDDDSHSTISRRIHKVDHRIPIHIATSILESRSQAQMYNNAYHVLIKNIPSLKDSHSSSTRGHLYFGATYITLRIRHRTLKQGHLDPLRYRVEKIPAYISKLDPN